MRDKQKLVDMFNEAYQVGQKVRFHSFKDENGNLSDERFVDTYTTTGAYLNFAGEPVVFLKDVRGYVSLEHVVVNDQEGAYVL